MVDEDKISTLLLVDDNENTNFLQTIVLKRTGLVETIKIAKHGEEALAYLNNSQEDSENYPYPQLILLDINMPVMDAWDFLQAYEKLPGALRQAKVIILQTTNLRQYDKERIKELKTPLRFIPKMLTVEQIQELCRIAQE